MGDTLMLDTGPNDQVRLKAGAVELSTGRVGRVGPSLAVRVERPLTTAVAKPRFVK